MKNLLRLSCFLSFVFACSMFAGTASAQWTANTRQFYGQIHIVKFLDAIPGAGNEGFVGDDTGIWYTNNTGATWTRATITNLNNTPFPFHSGWVTDITFADAMHGFAVIDSNYGSTVADSGILITSNGGQTWVFDDQPGTPDSGRGIYYNRSNGRLFVATADSGRAIVVSTDNGATWSVLDSGFDSYTGFAFTNGLRGVVATQGSTCALFPQVKYYWRYTTDGGLTWQRTGMNVESWQPAGIPTTETFFAATTNYCQGAINQILRSDNNAVSFGPLPNYLPVMDTLNQAMMGDGCALFAASAAGINGMWYSVNEGGVWSLMMGPNPNPPVDTRFYVSPTTVWSFKTDSLYSAPRPHSADIHVWPDTISFKDAACHTTSDTTVYMFGCNCANNPMLTGDSIHRFNPTDSAPMSIVPPVPPSQPLCAGGIGSAGAVQIHFQPIADSPDTADFHLIFSDNGTTVDDTIHMTANGITPKPTFTVPKTITLSSPGCGPNIDTCIQIVNTSCDTIIFTTNQLNEDALCKCQLQISGYCQLTDQGSITLLPGDIWCLQIDYTPGLTIGTCTASFSLNWQTSDGLITGSTNLVNVVGNTTTSVKPSFRGFKINRPNCCTANVSLDTLIYFFNQTCDTITLLKKPIIESINDGGDPSYANFTVEPGSHPLSYPIHVPPGGNVPITIGLHCEKGTSKAKIRFDYTISAQFASIYCAEDVDCSAYASDSLVDTLIMISAESATPPTMKPNNISFSSVSCCDSTQTRTITITAGCQPDTITGLAFDSAGKAVDTANIDFFIVPPGLALPYYLSPGQIVTFQIGYRPRCLNGQGGSESHYNVVVSLGTFGSDSTQLGATSTNQPAASPSFAVLALATIKFCGHTCDTTTLHNASCGSIKIDSITQTADGSFTIAAPAVGTPLTQGDSAPVIVCLTPQSATDIGALSDTVVFWITDLTGTLSTATYDTLVLNAYVNPPVPGYTVTQLANVTICDSTVIGETFTFTNKGKCYTYTITGATSGNLPVTVQPVGTPFPVTIDTGKSQAFNVTFMPTTVGTDSGWIVLTNSDGTTDSVHYDFTDTSCASQVDSLVFSMPDSVVSTPNCTPANIPFTVSSSAGGGTVDSVTLTGSPQFTAPRSSGVALPYNGTVTFDPNIVGNDAATLTVTVSIHGTRFTKTVGLKGIVTATKDSARIGVISPTNTCIHPNDTDVKELDVILRDTIQDALGATQLTYIVNYNRDLLWKPNFVTPPGTPPGTGWSLVGTPVEESDGFHVTMKYTPGSSGFTPANSVLLQIMQYGAISNSLTTTAKLTDPHFNDVAFDTCTLKPLVSTSDSANICIDTTCPTNFTLLALQGNLVPVTGIQVIPNPAHKDGSAATLHFTTNVAGNVTADVLDALGHSVVVLSTGAMETGDHAIAIPTDQIPEGAYFTRISVGGVTVIRKFVLEKE